MVVNSIMERQWDDQKVVCWKEHELLEETAANFKSNFFLSHICYFKVQYLIVVWKIHTAATLINIGKKTNMFLIQKNTKCLNIYW